jgi:hypothetical protein
MLVSSLHATDRLTLGSFFELDLPKKQIGHQPSQPRIFELEFGNPVVGAARAIGRARVVGRDDCGLNPKQRFAPPVQGHDTHTKRTRNFALRFPLRRYDLCLPLQPRRAAVRIAAWAVLAACAMRVAPITKTGERGVIEGEHVPPSHRRQGKDMPRPSWASSGSGL